MRKGLCVSLAVLACAVCTLPSVGCGDNGGDNVWKQQLVSALWGADRLVAGLTESYGGVAPAPVFEVQGPDKITELVDLIEINESKSWFHDMCHGDVLLSFYRQDELLVTLSYHHGKSFRWRHGKWKGDALLTGKSQRAMNRWLERNGWSSGFQAAREGRLARNRRQEAEDKRFASFFPAQFRGALVDVFPGYNALIGQQIATGMADKKALAKAVCQALGVTSESWTSTMPKERRVLAAVATVSDEDFLAALEELKDDPTGLRGAARLYFSERYERKVPQSLRAQWTVRLAEATLEHGWDEDKTSLFRYLEDADQPEVKDLLHKVVRGEVGRERDLEADYFQEPGIRTGAAMVLALQGDRTVKDDVLTLLADASWPQDIAALEVSLALLGDPAYLKKEHFELSSISIGLAALQAIEQFGGAYGVELLLQAPDIHPHGSWSLVGGGALEAFERITGWRGSQHQRHRDRDAYIAAARRWWQENGDRIVKEQRAKWLARQRPSATEEEPEKSEPVLRAPSAEP